jgi:hypothetical protein
LALNNEQSPASIQHRDEERERERKKKLKIIKIMYTDFITKEMGL